MGIEFFCVLITKMKFFLWNENNRFDKQKEGKNQLFWIRIHSKTKKNCSKCFHNLLQCNNNGMSRANKSQWSKIHNHAKLNTKELLIYKWWWWFDMRSQSTIWHRHCNNIKSICDTHTHTHMHAIFTHTTWSNENNERRPIR